QRQQSNSKQTQRSGLRNRLTKSVDNRACSEELKVCAGDPGSVQGDIKNLLTWRKRLGGVARNKPCQLSLHCKRNAHWMVVHKIIRQHNGTGESQRATKQDISESYAVNSGCSRTESNIQLTGIENSSDIQDRSRPAR